MFNKIIDAFKKWLDEYHYGSISGMLLEYGMIAFAIIAITLLVYMFLFTV